MPTENTNTQPGVVDAEAEFDAVFGEAAGGNDQGNNDGAQGKETGEEGEEAGAGGEQADEAAGGAGGAGEQTQAAAAAGSPGAGTPAVQPAPTVEELQAQLSAREAELARVRHAESSARGRALAYEAQLRQRPAAPAQPTPQEAAAQAALDKELEEYPDIRDAVNRIVDKKVKAAIDLVMADTSKTVDEKIAGVRQHTDPLVQEAENARVARDRAALEAAVPGADSLILDPKFKPWWQKQTDNFRALEHDGPAGVVTILDAFRKAHPGISPATRPPVDSGKPSTRLARAMSPGSSPPAGSRVVDDSDFDGAFDVAAAKITRSQTNSRGNSR